MKEMNDIRFKVADSKDSAVTIVRAISGNSSSRIRRRMEQSYGQLVVHCFSESEFEKLQKVHPVSK